MRKLLLGLSIVAFLASGTIAFASTNNEVSSIITLQDGKKKNKATKKKDCNSKSGLTTKCDEGKTTTSKDCCSHNKTSQKEPVSKKGNPKKK